MTKEEAITHGEFIVQTKATQKAWILADAETNRLKLSESSIADIVERIQADPESQKLIQTALDKLQEEISGDQATDESRNRFLLDLARKPLF